MARPIIWLIAAGLIALLSGCYGEERKALPSDAPDTLKQEARKCDRADMLSCHNLAIAYWKGEGVPKDVDKARTLFSTACQSGAMLSCSALENIDPTEDLDSSEAAGRIKMACDNGLPAACDRWAELLANAGRDDEALSEARRQCRRSPSSSCVTAGKILEERGQTEEARALFARGCAQGIVIACRFEAELEHEAGEGEPGQRVFTLYTQACRGGDGIACMRLADLYTNGEGPKEDPTYAERLREDACAYGIEEACHDSSTSNSDL
jgi:TPR repeat protein